MVAPIPIPSFEHLLLRPLYVVGAEVEVRNTSG